MKYQILILVVIAVASAVDSSQYAGLLETIHDAPFPSMGLAQIEATAMSGGAMDEVAILCVKLKQEIANESHWLIQTHYKFQAACKTQLAAFDKIISRLDTEIADHDEASASYATQWASLKPKFRPLEEQRATLLKEYLDIEANIKRKQLERDKAHRAHLANMEDHNKALRDIKKMRLTLQNSSINDKASPGLGLIEGADIKKFHSSFLEMMRNAKSSKVSSLVEVFQQELEATKDSGMDVIYKLLYGVRDQLTRSMVAAEEVETANIKAWKETKLRMTDQVNKKKADRAYKYWLMGKIREDIGGLMLLEGEQRKKSCQKEKTKNKNEIDRSFLATRCFEEPPVFNKGIATKIEEMKTLDKMLGILRNLGWSGRVFKSLSKITAGIVDENPEQHFTMAYQWNAKGKGKFSVYDFFNTGIGNFDRVAYKLELDDRWVWVSFDAWTRKITDYGIPTKESAKVWQKYVKNMNVRASKTSQVKTGDFSQGNIEFWGQNYYPANQKNIAGGSQGSWDFGDERATSGSYGSMQIHNYERKETVLAVNNWLGTTDFGVGNNEKGEPDWTFTHNAEKFKKKVLTIYCREVHTREPTPAPTNAPTKKLEKEPVIPTKKFG